MSEIRANTIANAAGTGPADLTGQWATKAFARFASSNLNEKSGNITSLTDNGTGDYTISFTNSMADNLYAVLIGGRRGSPVDISTLNEATGSYDVVGFDGSSGTAIDVNHITATLGDLA